MVNQAQKKDKDAKTTGKKARAPKGKVKPHGKGGSGRGGKSGVRSYR
jgi:hypothetical protein